MMGNINNLLIHMVEKPRIRRSIATLYAKGRRKLKYSTRRAGY